MNSWFEDKEFWKVMNPKLFRKSHWDMAPEEIDQIIRLTGIMPGDEVLDLCCGPGRHSLELARKKFKVTGVDLTKAYIEQAADTAEREGFSIEFVQEDMRQFNKPGKFKAILLMYTSFGYFEKPDENLKVLRNCYQSLKNGGSLIIDLIGKEILARKFLEREWEEIDSTFWLEERKIINDWNQIDNRWIMLNDKEKIEYRFKIRIYSASELSNYLYECGFKTVDIFGALDGRQYDHQAERLIAVACR